MLLWSSTSTKPLVLSILLFFSTCKFWHMYTARCNINTTILVFWYYFQAKFIDIHISIESRMLLHFSFTQTIFHFSFFFSLSFFLLYALNLSPTLPFCMPSSVASFFLLFSFSFSLPCISCFLFGHGQNVFQLTPLEQICPFKKFWRGSSDPTVTSDHLLGQKYKI